MKKIIFTFILFAFAANVSVRAQFDVDSLGNTYVSKNIYAESTPGFTFGTTNDVSITFKVNNSLAGFTGYTENSNVSFGYEALSNSFWDGNVAVGYRALYSNTLGSNNTANGMYALYSNTDGLCNAANGAYALYGNTYGSANTASGVHALYSNRGGYGNAANGAYALYSNREGYGNTANGVGALYSNTENELNTATGYYALYRNTGPFNTADGTYALHSNTTGYGNTAIGYSADVNAGNLFEATAIGCGALITQSNTVVIGNPSVTDIGGFVDWTDFSDGRAKKNIRTEVPGLDFVKLLQPIMYNLDLDVIDELQRSDDPQINHFRDSLRLARSPEIKEIDAKARANKEKIVYSGFVAQDVEEAAHSVGYDFSGVNAPPNGKGTYGLRYAKFVVPLVKSVQELNEKNDRLQEQVNELTGIVNRLLEKEDNPSILKSEKSATDELGTIDPVIAQCKLYQNTPNPFSQNTEIRFYVSENVKLAKLCIYNLQGAQIKQILVTQRREGSQWISGSELTAGMYLYALIADGKEVDVKRMVLTE